MELIFDIPGIKSGVMNKFVLLFLALAAPAAAPADETYADLAEQLQREATASFSDGISTGFYINAYTTKHCPTMDGVLGQMRRGLERLEQSREAMQLRLQEERQQQQGADAAKPLTTKRQRALNGKSNFMGSLSAP